MQSGQDSEVTPAEFELRSRGLMWNNNSILRGCRKELDQSTKNSA